MEWTAMRFLWRVAAVCSTASAQAKQPRHERENWMASSESELVRELTERLGQDQSKVATTIRLTAATMKRLRTQEKRWSTSQSFIIEKALGPALDDLEKAVLPGEDAVGA